jgi:1,2-diacylglycerol 3-alpha-glucosyltransferase
LIILDLLEKYAVATKMVTLPTGIDSQAFANDDGARFKQNFGIPTDKKLLLSVSRVAFEKNIPAIIVAYALLRQSRDDIHLVIAGEGPAKNQCVALAVKLKLGKSISFVGYLDRSTQLVDCYHVADIFVFSSKTETQGLVLPDAIASGTAVVSVAEMGNKDVLTEELGVKIAEGCPTDFSTKISEVLEDPALYTNLVNTTIAYAREWGPLTLAKKMHAYYTKVFLTKQESHSVSIRQV